MSDADVARVVKWVRPATYGAPPPARGGHAAVMVGNLFIIFGGTYYKGDGKFTYVNDLWALDVDTMKWHSPKCAGRGPGARYGHAAVVIDFKVYIFGGKGEGGILYNDLWCLDVENWAWQLIPSATAAPPSARFGHSIVAVGNKIAMFGGWDGKTCHNDLWLFDLVGYTWLRPPATGLVPSARHGHSAIYDEAGARMIVFGGWHAGADGVPEYQRDVRSLDLHTLAWSRPRISGDSPTGRYSHSVACVGNVMVTTGGYDGPRDATAESTFPSEPITIPYTPGMGGDALVGAGGVIEVAYGVHADTYFLDTESLEWIHPALAGRGIGYRYGAAAAASGAQILIFGGWEEGRPLNELVVLDMSGLIDGGGSGGDADGANDAYTGAGVEDDGVYNDAS